MCTLPAQKNPFDNLTKQYSIFIEVNKKVKNKKNIEHYLKTLSKNLKRMTNTTETKVSLTKKIKNT